MATGLSSSVTKIFVETRYLGEYWNQMEMTFKQKIENSSSNLFSKWMLEKELQHLAGLWHFSVDPEPLQAASSNL